MADDQSPVAWDQLAFFQQWLNRTLVVLVQVYWHLDKKGNSKGEPRVAACSGFVMTFGEMWFLVTAGHVLEDLDKLVAHRQVKVVDSFIVDSLGSEAQFHNNIPFSYEESIRHWIYEDGLDWGLIMLTPHEKRLLQANRIQPIGAENWVNHDIDACTGFVLLGVPAEMVAIDGQTRVKIGSVITSVKRLHDLPKGADNTKHERFIGETSKRIDLRSLEGTSGGPIMGFREINGQTRFWVVALQSKAIGTKYVLGCPTKLISDLVLEHIRMLVEELDEGEPQFPPEAAIDECREPTARREAATDDSSR
jgi:hypothetical protein